MCPMQSAIWPPYPYVCGFDFQYMHETMFAKNVCIPWHKP